MIQDIYDRWHPVTLHPEWGAMLSADRWALIRAPWIPLAPGTAFFLAILACNLVAEGLRLAGSTRPGARQPANSRQY